MTVLEMNKIISKRLKRLLKDKNRVKCKVLKVYNGKVITKRSIK